MQRMMIKPQDLEVPLCSDKPVSWGLQRVFFTDHTLAHPLNCRGGVVARLSRLVLHPGIEPGSDAWGMRLIH